MDVELAVGLDTFPDDLRALTSFARPDYCDRCTAATSAAGTLTPEAWARALLEEAPLARRSARRLWRALGLRLGPPGSGAHVQGWRIADREADWIRLETASWYMAAEAVVWREPQRVTISLFLRFDRPVAALVWAPVGPLHRRGLPVMLHQAVRAQERTDG